MSKKSADKRRRAAKRQKLKQQQRQQQALELRKREKALAPIKQAIIGYVAIDPHNPLGLFCKGPAAYVFFEPQQLKDMIRHTKSDYIAWNTLPFTLEQLAEAIERHLPYQLHIHVFARIATLLHLELPPPSVDENQTLFLDHHLERQITKAFKAL